MLPECQYPCFIGDYRAYAPRVVPLEDKVLQRHRVRDGVLLR